MISDDPPPLPLNPQNCLEDETMRTKSPSILSDREGKSIRVTPHK